MRIMIRAMTSLLAAGMATAALAAGTGGTVTFNVTTSSAGGKYAPKHVMAVWVTDAKGAFVRTLAVYGQKQRRSLREWPGTQVDGLTGATLPSHKPQTFTWDCKDSKGAVVADGTYEIHVEFVDGKASQITPKGAIQFTKGATPVNLMPGNTGNFKSMSLKFTPGAAR